MIATHEFKSFALRKVGDRNECKGPVTCNVRQNAWHSYAVRAKSIPNRNNFILLLLGRQA